ncbi:hypothetical protein CPLU01_13480 [Colletotrichum plurivorum]|uniref:Uncharacterized protein n=1 Tax=Colletotrichum plurivorum TaxID=2175906 RepID=A0A8H6JR81_9PEZI|nr:hypothetical protein CPLU01_13480 [Colletotrichum plurivorum]
MKFTDVTLAIFAAVALAAPVLNDVNDLAARQWQCFSCSDGKRQCCGPLGAEAVHALIIRSRLDMLA